MPNYIIITTTTNVVVSGTRYARDDGGDVHIYDGDRAGEDPVVTVDADAFVAIGDAGEVSATAAADALGDAADHIALSDPASSPSRTDGD